ncbi:hypothetical protein DA01_02470 [Dehalococcoides mccartyi]|uniref:HicB-like antitoxin of toxin-antitoxin system domain-containing protein n=1 Tax=Dehalococcoides mccartyi TaxID=61435 RepID=A0A0V8M3H5_9CHLR|nr:type II toxin-antitoxin system HicB family antitoxin [Dehalococcoides mccartyi]AGG05735.1 hypothetical protein dcmb_102 [Dehalococcoides mccartyi DCMB5]AQW61972.1 HicB family protein [Dehalococcoides mccartyi]KSV18312.1 hypothetical protein DA01_02470 [Dehalococcoides mccartyi]
MQKITSNLPLSYYMELKYQIILIPDPSGGYVATIEELPGCLSQGDSIEEALDNIAEAKELWLECTYENKQEIELPRTSGNFERYIIRYI